MQHLFLSILLAILCFCSAAKAQDNYFRILSFTLDGKEVENYSVLFVVNDKEIVPVRQGNKVIIPNEVRDAEKSTIKFQAACYSFEYPVSPNLGYNEESKVQADINIGIDNKPFEFKIDSRDKKYFKKFKTMYFIQGAPSVKPGTSSLLIVDPVTTYSGDIKKKSKRTCRAY